MSFNKSRHSTLISNRMATLKNEEKIQNIEQKREELASVRVQRRQGILPDSNGLSFGLGLSANKHMRV